MPFIHVKTAKTPAKPPVGDIAKDFAEATGIRIEHITVTWEHYEAIESATPVIVDLLAPDINSERTVVKMLRAVADSIARRAKVPAEHIFINYREACSGRVFEAGKIVRW